MELIQNSVKKREGKKWKQRWVVLRKDSLHSRQEHYYYLFFYKDAAHAKEGKEKNTIPLNDFCGLDLCRNYDKEENILILVTSSQTVYLAFDQLPVRDSWKQTFIEHFGEAVSYKICIPDKQRLKAGDATIRLYSSFVSIVTSNNYKCLNRWYLNDIERYSALDDNHFMFEISSSLKTKGGNVINLLVNDNAHDISRSFDSVASEIRTNKPSTMTRHGSAMLEEQGQARRNVGDQNFFRRAILRASERMRKKKRRPTAPPAVKKRPCNNSAQEEENFRSLDRKKNPQISVDLDNDSLRRTLQISGSSSNNLNSPDGMNDHSPPDLPIKRTNNDQERSQHTTANLLIDSAPNDADTGEVKGSSSPIDTSTDDKTMYDSERDVFEEGDGKEEILQGINLTSVETSDKSDLSNRNARRSVDSFLSSYKNPAKFAIARTKGSNGKTKNEKTPTPPPRSPVSLGLTFQFPPAEEMEQPTDSIDNKDPVEVETEPSTLNNNIKLKEIKNNSTTLDTPPAAKKTSGSASSWTSYDSDNPLRNDAYQNLPNFKQDSYNSDYASDLASRRKQKPDPLEFEHWAKATGDGKLAPSPSDSHPPFSDYVNIESPHSDDDNSYVNVSSQCNVNIIDNLKTKRNKPKPPRLKNPRNEFEKYDDDDSSIYHAVGALGADEGSYENVNGVRSGNSRNCNYLNVNKRLSPVNNSKLNYIDLGLPDNSNKATNCTSPATTSYNKSDYTRIDVDATGAINRSMAEHRPQRDNPSNKTPTRFSR